MTIEYTTAELHRLEEQDIEQMRRAAAYARDIRRSGSPMLARERARKIALHALRERGELRGMVRDLQHALRLMLETADRAEVRTLAITTTADINHRLWRMRQLRRAAFGRQS